jgi:hypothetical protein
MNSPKITFNFTPNEAATMCNLLQILSNLAVPTRKKANVSVDILVCAHLQVKLGNEHSGKLFSAKPTNGIISYKFSALEALVLYSFTAGNSNFYFFNVQVESNDNI